MRVSEERIVIIHKQNPRLTLCLSSEYIESQFQKLVIYLSRPNNLSDTTRKPG